MNSFQTVRSFTRTVVIATLAALASSAAAQTTVLGDGSNPPSLPSVCPGDGWVPLDGFTLTTTGTETTASVGVQLYPTGAYVNLDRIEIRDAANTQMYGTVVPTADYHIIRMATPLPLNTNNSYRIWVQVKGHSAMPPPTSGKSPTISARVLWYSSRYAKSGTDGASATVTLSNIPPGEVKVSSITANGTTMTVGWTTTQRVVVLMRQGAPVTDAPVDGTSYTTGTIGASTIVCAGTGTRSSCTTGTALTANASYFFKVFTIDSCGNYSLGTEVGPVVNTSGGGTEGSASPYLPTVGVLNPVPGPVMSGSGAVPGFKAQLRVFSPVNGVGAAQNVLEVRLYTSPTSYVTLTPSSQYGTTTTSGVWETGPLGLQLAPGSYTLQGWARNATGSTYSGRIGVTVIAAKGDGNLLVRDNSSTLCTDCHTSYKAHSPEAGLTKYGSWYAGCRACHTPHDTTNVSLVANQITPPALTGVQTPAKVIFSTRTGYATDGGVNNPAAASFANADAAANGGRATGVCQVCHTRTDNYRADGTRVTHYPTSNCGSCHQHTEGFKGGGCDGCHGDSARATFSKVAPPQDTCGNTTVSGGTGKNRVGAHAKHLTGGTFSPAVACANCHIESPTRPDHPATPTCNDADRAIMTWGALAKGTVDAWTPEVFPTFDPVTQTCSTTYCHGAFTNGNAATVAWNSGPVACGSCHDVPMTTGSHSGSETQCTGCHAAGYTSLTAVDATQHMNGIREAQGCTGCHGGNKAVIAAGAVEAEVNAMPPTDATVAKNSATTFIGVGAHVQHANSDSSLAPVLACTDCHNWAAFPTDTAHRDGSSPMIASINWNRTNKTCSVAACHGTATPVWTTVDGSFKTCGSCHGAPPAVTTNHPQNTTCADCHPGYATPATVVRNTHVDGAVNVNTSSGCARCHGLLGTNAVAATSVDAAPGVNTNEDSRGNAASATNIAGVGAHRAHLQARWFNGVIACTQCHPSPAYTDATHANGAAAVPFPAGSLARTGGAAASYATNACASTYCHGQFNGGTGADPTWASAGLVGTSMQCYSCHGTGTNPMPPITADHPQNGTCATCHTGYTAATVALADHIDGQIDTNAATGCARCHGLLGTNAVGYVVNAAPGITTGHYDSKGNNAATVNTVGAHAVHVQAGSLSGAIACSACHAASITDTVHVDGALGMVWSSLVTDGGRLSPTYNGTFQCSSNYCHSRANPLGEVGGDPVVTSQAWNVTTNMTCTSCHGDATTATLSARHDKHLAAGTYNLNCDVCHSTTGNRTAITNVANHLDGQKDTGFGTYNTVNQTSATYTSTGSTPNYTCNTTYCHSNGTDNVYPFAAPTRTTLNWSTGTASTDCGDCHGGNTGATGAVIATGSHSNHINSAAYVGAVYGCATCHDATISTTANDRTLDPTTGLANHIDGQRDVDAVTSWNGTTCATNQCHSDGTETTPYKVATWSTGGTVGGTCRECHGSDASNAFAPGWGEPNYANVTTNVDTRNSHMSHVSRTEATAKTQCVDCHPTTTVTAAGAMVVGGTHMDASRQVTRTGMTYNESTEQCSNIDCHGGAGTVAVWGDTLDCSACHMGATGATDAEVDNYNYGTAPMAKLDPEDWINYGHGRPAASGAYDSTNPAAAFDTAIAVSTDDGCKYCHDKTVPHGQFGVDANPFRLANVGTGTTLAEKQGVCTVCHGGGTYLGKGATKTITAAHYGAKHAANGKGGELCWDCHDPHGDYKYAATAGVMAYMIDETPIRTHTVSAGSPLEWGVSAVTAAATPEFRKALGTNATAWDWGDYARSTRTGVCQVCHTATTHFLAATWDSTAPGDFDHNDTGGRCVACHSHNQTPTDAFKQAACDGCHGNPARVAAPLADGNVTAAPPQKDGGTLPGVVTDLEVGAHEIHVNNSAGTALSNPLACDECHPTPIGGTHAATRGSENGQIVWNAGTIATSNSKTPTAWNRATPTCTNTWCHSLSGSTASPSWISTAGRLGCTACHATTALTTGSHALHLTGTYAKAGALGCDQCHPNVNAGGTALTDKSTHVNGTKDVLASLGYTGGNCTTSECHSKGTEPTTDYVAVAWGGADTTDDCTECHGTEAGSVLGAPWYANGFSDVNTANGHQDHLKTGDTAVACYWCHNTTVNSSGVLQAAVHLDFSPAATPDVSSTFFTYNASTETCTSITCHGGGTAQWGSTTNIACTSCHAAGTVSMVRGPLGTPTGTNTRRNVVQEFAGTWSHKRSATPTARAVADADCIPCHMEGTKSTVQTDLPHADGLINLRNPDTGLNARTVSFTEPTSATTPGSYNENAGADLAFARFSRNLGSNVIEAEAAAIMVNQCLKCHDANGANAADGSGRVGTAIAGKPFNTTIVGAGYDGANGLTACASGTNGCVTNIAKSFATTNASYHPILGKQNNTYIPNTRMKAPWNTLSPAKTAGNLTSGTNVWGFRITCWDCHAPNGSTASTILTATNTAHGSGAATSTTTLRAQHWIVNSNNLCTACHNVIPTTGASTSTHGLGSAWSTSGNATPGGIARTSCWRCHGSTDASNATFLVRPVRAEDVHGFNQFSYPNTTDTLWPAGATNTYKPYGFMRNGGTQGMWRSPNYWTPRSASDVTGRSNGQCATTGGTGCSSGNGTYTPGGVY